MLSENYVPLPQSTYFVIAPNVIFTFERRGILALYPLHISETNESVCTSVFRKNTCTGLYTDFSRSLYKTNLVKTSILRTYKISVGIYFIKKSVTLKNVVPKFEKKIRTKDETTLLMIAEIFKLIATRLHWLPF